MVQPTARETQAEFERAALEFIDRNEPFDEERLREQTINVLQVREDCHWCISECTFAEQPYVESSRYRRG